MGRRRPAKRILHQTDKSEKDTRKCYKDIIRENDAFVSYYKAQNICEVEEFEQVIASLKTDLPATFRITGSKGEAHKMLSIVKSMCAQDTGLGAVPLPWYPEELAWQMDLTRNDIRRSELHYKLHNFLISETEHGTISRQETVSMIPPLLMDIKSHHKILDMCAAPGSKTAQILELLHQNCDTSIPSGYVVANDVDNKRCYMLVHQAKRLNSPCVAIINHDAAMLPNMTQTDPETGKRSQVQFDRILCDVPCSGDGTLRKNADIWMKWSPANALNLHSVQYRILRRGCELLAPGGRLVYSTCSLNPIENEAVIARTLAESKGCLQLLDVTDTLSALKFRTGLDNWKVFNRHLEYFNSYEETPEQWRLSIQPHLFPPSEEDRMKYQLHKCIRILPHHQNTGAFFVAVLVKANQFADNTSKSDATIVSSTTQTVANANDELQVNSQSEGNEITDNSDQNKRTTNAHIDSRQRKRRKRGIFREDPFLFFEKNEPVWQSIQRFYDVSEQFDATCLLTRCQEGKKKNVYLTSTAIRDLLLQNQHILKFINTGVKAFVRCDNKHMECAFRIANDGLESIYPFIGSGRKISIERDDLERLLMNDNPEKSPLISTLTEPTRIQTEGLSVGSCVMVYEESASDANEPLVLHLSGWRGQHSLRCYMSKHSVMHFLRLIGGDISKFDINKFEKNDANKVDNSNDKNSESISQQQQYLEQHHLEDGLQNTDK